MVTPLLVPTELCRRKLVLSPGMSHLQSCSAYCNHDLFPMEAPAVVASRSHYYTGQELVSLRDTEY